MQGLNGRLIEIYFTIYVCSFIDFTCSPPVEFPEKFNNWHECMLRALKNQNLLINVPQDVVEKID